MRDSWLVRLSLVYILGLFVAAPLRADDKGKGKADGDKSSAFEVAIDNLLREAFRGEVKHGKKEDSGKKAVKDDDDDDDKKGKKKKDDDKKKDDKKKGAKSRIVRVDLNKLPPGIAKQVEKVAEKDNKKDKDDDKKKKKKKDD